MQDLCYQATSSNEDVESSEYLYLDPLCGSTFYSAFHHLSLYIPLTIFYYDMSLLLHHTYIAVIFVVKKCLLSHLPVSPSPMPQLLLSFTLPVPLCFISCFIPYTPHLPPSLTTPPPLRNLENQV